MNKVFIDFCSSGDASRIIFTRCDQLAYTNDWWIIPPVTRKIGTHGKLDILLLVANMIRDELMRFYLAKIVTML